MYVFPVLLLWCKITITGFFFTTLVENNSKYGCKRFNIRSYPIAKDV